MDAAVDLLLQAAHSRSVDRHALAKELLDALHSAEWDGPRRQQLAYQPLFDLAMAIGHDESYSAALTALLKWDQQTPSNETRAARQYSVGNEDVTAGPYSRQARRTPLSR